LPVGAYVGKEEIMKVVAPVGPVYQAGTLSGNPLAMAAGHALLSELRENPAIYDTLERTSAELARGLSDALTTTHIDHQLNRVGSMLTLFFTAEPVTDFPSANTLDKEKFADFFHHMLAHGIYFPPSPFEALFLSAALTEADINRTVEAATKWAEAQ
jgi:glutamate-1-semialdehyde 2,1-aminomutase